MHGHSVGGFSTTYAAWNNCRSRCRNEKSKDWPLYGGRGIKVCERWSKFENFLADMGEKPKGMTLERDDPDGDYEPGNCRWATRLEQGRNKRNNRLLTFLGQTMPLTAWAEKVGLKRNALEARLDVLGWPLERALTTPKRQPSKEA